MSLEGLLGTTLWPVTKTFLTNVDKTYRIVGGTKRTPLQIHAAGAGCENLRCDLDCDVHTELTNLTIR